MSLRNLSKQLKETRVLAFPTARAYRRHSESRIRAAVRVTSLFGCVRLHRWTDAQTMSTVQTCGLSPKSQGAHVSAKLVDQRTTLTVVPDRAVVLDNLDRRSDLSSLSRGCSSLSEARRYTPVRLPFSNTQRSAVGLHMGRRLATTRSSWLDILSLTERIARAE